MRDADRDDAARAGLELHAGPVEVENRLAFEHVEARLERVDVRVDVTGRERDERQRHVRRAERAADEAARLEAARMAGQRVLELHVLPAHEAIARHAVGKLARARVSAHAPAPSPTTADAATASAIPSRPASPSGTRSAPRT